MRVGLSTACFADLCETEEAFGALRESGAECCEVYLRTFYEYRPEFLKKFCGRLENIAVTSVCVNHSNFEDQLFSPSRRIRGDGFYWLDQILRSAQLLQAKNYTLCGSADGVQNPDFDCLSQYINGAIGFCARYGAGLCLKNGGLYNAAGGFSALKQRCGGLSGVLDLNSARLSGYPYTMYLKDMSGSIAYVRVCDFDGRGAACLPGLGTFDFADFFANLAKEGFDGDVIIDAHAHSVEEAKDSVKYIKGIINKQGENKGE